MRMSRRLALGFVFVVIAGFGAWKLIYPTYTYRYRMTVNVEFDGKLYPGYSVIELRLRRQPKLLPEVPAVTAKVSGEAVFIDLGSGKNIFAVLASGPIGTNYDYPKQLVPEHFNLSYSDEDLGKFEKLQGKWKLPPDRLPTFATFTDLNDPKTARTVAPQDFGSAFGSGARLQDVEIEMTTDAVTRNIQKTLPWLPHPEYLNGHRSCDPAAPHCLDGGHFSLSSRSRTGIIFLPSSARLGQTAIYR